MVRVAGLHDQVDAGIDARGPDGLSARRDDRAPQRAQRGARRAGTRAHGRTPCARRSPRTGIRVVDCADCSSEELATIDRLFSEQIFPVLTPLAVGPGRPFPYISNLSLSIGVSGSATRSRAPRRSRA